MKVKGKLLPPQGKEKYWSVEIPVLSIYTQGKTKKEAALMAKDAIETLVNKKNFKVMVEITSDQFFTVKSDDHHAFMAFVLKQLRLSKNISAREASKKLHSKSPNAYARYEQGKASPSIEKFEELIQAIDPTLELELG